MTKLTDEAEVDQPLDEAVSACVDLITQAGWELKAREPDRLEVKVGVSVLRNPSKLELVFRAIDESRTSVRINGKILGVGPLQKGHLLGEINRLRDALGLPALELS